MTTSATTLRSASTGERVLVRTTNGGEIVATVTSRWQVTYALSLEADNGRCFTVEPWRVATVEAVCD